MNKPPAIITGLGAISAAGGSVPKTIATLRSGERHVGPLTLFPSPIAAPVFQARGLPEAPGSAEGRTLRLARHALAEALSDAGLASGDLRGRRVGICFGTTVACQLNDVEFYAEFRKSAAAPLEPVDRFLKGNLAEQIGRSLGAVGPRLTVVNACSSGTDAIGVALGWLRAGLCDIAIAGGADELNRVPLCGFHALGVMSSAPCAPFDRDRQGLNLGEGAGILVLEMEAQARRRGVTPRLLVAGYGAAGDAYHMTAPRPDGSGLESAIRQALGEAGIGPADVDFINAHGTATRENDKVEGGTLARVFGPDVRALSTKGLTGHTLGAAGGLEAVFAAIGLREGWIPSNAGFVTRDDEIPFSPVSEVTAVRNPWAVSTSLAFGGLNAALVFGLTGGRA